MRLPIYSFSITKDYLELQTENAPYHSREALRSVISHSRIKRHSANAGAFRQPTSRTVLQGRRNRRVYVGGGVKRQLARRNSDRSRQTFWLRRPTYLRKNNILAYLEGPLTKTEEASLNPRPFFFAFRHLRQWRGVGTKVGATPPNVSRLSFVEIIGKKQRISHDEYSRLVVFF